MSSNFGLIPVLYLCSCYIFCEKLHIEPFLRSTCWSWLWLLQMNIFIYCSPLLCCRSQFWVNPRVPVWKVKGLEKMKRLKCQHSSCSACVHRGRGRGPPDIAVNDSSDSMAHYRLTQSTGWPLCVLEAGGEEAQALSAAHLWMWDASVVRREKPQSGWFRGKWYHIYFWHSSWSWLRFLWCDQYISSPIPGQGSPEGMLVTQCKWTAFL